MVLSNIQSDQGNIAPLPAYRKLQRVLFAACIALGPLMAVLEVLTADRINPPGGSIAIANAAAANATAVQLHFICSFAASFLLLFGFLGMALLAMRRSPWLATIGGAIALLGVTATAAFVAQDDLTSDMAQLGSSTQFVALWERFNGDTVMTVYLYLFVVGALFLGPILLGIALGRARLIPVWAVTVIILSRLLQVAAFPTHINPNATETVTFALLFIGSVPAALAMLKFRDEVAPVHAGEEPAPTIGQERSHPQTSSRSNEKEDQS